MKEVFLIEWKNEYSVNNEEIDKQHKRLFELINDFFNSFQLGQAEDSLSETIIETINYTKYHFEYEEKILKECRYPEYNIHFKEHVDFKAKIYVFHEKFENGDFEVAYDLMLFLRDWLIKHVMLEDQKYKNHIKT
ncbi:MAG: hemerythrin family protein [Bacteroidales bacterium]|nr:hemerythrin family protein [Bacteroidales bacterium]